MSPAKQPNRERVSIREMLSTLDQETSDEEIRLWGKATNGTTSHKVDLSDSPKYQEIVALLHDQPLLVHPTLEWLRTKRAQMAQAQLSVLFSPEELQAMYEEARNTK
jgi:hypothetical protein